jgi:hypothetical protein
MARTSSDTKTELLRRRAWFRERELGQDPNFGETGDDDPKDHGLMDNESVFADEGETPMSLDKLFR